MPDDPNANENIDIPPIPKETAGAVAGAALGSMMGPAGAIVGGIAGAIAGKAASERRLAGQKKFCGAKPRKESLRNRASDRPPNGQKPNRAEDRHRVPKKGDVAKLPIRKVGRAGFEPAKA